MPTTELKIPATDGFLLDARLITPTAEPRGAVIINSGTGTRKEFYRQFAEYLAAGGFVVILYDYRGIGGSRPRSSLKNFSAAMRDWGEKDMTGVLEWLGEHFPLLPKYIIGHSIGGQLVGLMPNHAALRGVVMVASSSGYWRWLKTPTNFFSLLMWYGYVPISNAVFGYVPTKRWGLGEDLPAGVAREWSEWCKRKAYLTRFFDRNITSNYFRAVTCPILSLNFTDDPIANRRTVPELLGYFTAAPKQVCWFAPEDIGTAKIGHNGFFSKHNEPNLWATVTDWLAEQECLADK